MRKLLVTLSLMCAANVAFANVNDIQVSTNEIEAFEYESLSKGTTNGGFAGGELPAPTFPGDRGPINPGTPSTSEKVGDVIRTARDIVALGEAVYELVQKGKPSNTTSYAPISVVPKDATGNFVDPFDMEYCSMPVTKKFKSVVKSGGAAVVTFEYMVIFTHSCSYNEFGNYIQQALVQPVSVKTEYGWDFNAEMKLSGVMNHGSRVDPVAGVMLTMKYGMRSWRAAFEQNHTIHITGKGEIKTY